MVSTIIFCSIYFYPIILNKVYICISIILSYGLEDYNSTPANKAQNENDLGQADIIIGPKTGVVLYIGFAIIFSSIMAVGIYIVNKKVINKI